MGIEHKPNPTQHLPTPRATATPLTGPSSQAPRARAASQSDVPAKLPEDFIAIRSTQEGSDEGPRLTVMPRSALLQRTYSTALEYLAPQIHNATFTTRDMPGFEGTPVNIAPEHWVELLPLTKVMDAKLPPQRAVRRAVKSAELPPKKKRCWWPKAKAWGTGATTFWVLIVLMIAIYVYMYHL
ncbi:hypothetical protein CPB85DRAFT_1347256 [Mucidula mucida]|nr:hypothetical protein CPB85DRAFT_1347256 [Mucidula mucida]